MTIVITSWRRGSTSHLSGQRICDSTGRMDSWSCATIDSNPFVACSWFGSSGPAYITEGCYNGLTDGEKAACVSRYAGIVTSSGYYYVYNTAYYNHYRLKIESIVKCWSAACYLIRPGLHCEGVVCDDACIGADKYSQACVTEGENAGTCTFDELIQANAPGCPGYDPCLDVVCEPVCDGYDLYETLCVGGVCVKGALIEANNREICGYDPCRDVVCVDKCYGVDMWSTVCDEGECLPGALLEPNSEECGYVPSGCNEGELRGAVTCADGSTVYTEICHNNAWVPTGDKCPEDIVPTTDVLKYLLIGAAIIAVYLFVKGR